MPQKIAIITKDPAISTAIHRAMLEQLESPKQPDAVLYAQDSNTPTSDSFQVYEGTNTAKKLGAHMAAFPEIDVDNPYIINKARVPLVHNDLLPQITAERVAPIRAHLLEDTEPTNEKDKKLLEEVLVDAALWAETLNGLAYRSAPEGTELLGGKAEPDPILHQFATDKKRNSKGLIGIQGGMGAEAGLKSFASLAQKGDSSLLLNNAATLPHKANEAEYILQLLDAGLQETAAMVNPLNHLIDDRNKLASTKPDAIIMTCNTAHYFEDDIINATGHAAIHLPQAGLESIPPKENGDSINLLLLSTTALAKSNLYEKTQEKLDRDDIQIITPESHMQEHINNAIWTDILQNKDAEAAAGKFTSVINAHQGKVDGIILGCTEVVFGIEKMEQPPELQIDNAEAAENTAHKIATAASKDRGNLRDDKISTILISSTIAKENSTPWEKLATSKNNTTIAR